MGENNSKWSNWQRINLQNIQAAHAAQFQKNKRPSEKRGQRTKQTFLQMANKQMVNKHTNRCSTSLIIREMQIKTTMRYHLRLVRVVAIRKSTNNKWWTGCREKGILLHCWWECKLVQPLWRIVWRFLKKLEIELPWPSNPIAGHIHQGNQNWNRHRYPNVHSSTIYNSQDMEAT